MSKPLQRKKQKKRGKRLLENENEEKNNIIFLTSVGRVIPSNADRNSVITEFHLNNNANVNVVNQNFVFEHDFTKVENLLFKFEWMGGTIYCYGIYLLVYKFENNWYYKNNVNTFLMQLLKKIPRLFLAI